MSDLGVELDLYPNNPISPLSDPKNAPRLSGIMVNSTEYTNLGVGNTDDIMLIGHADGLRLNTPWRVTSIRDAVKEMKYDSNSPLLRALLEAYYGGARDIHIMAVAPMSEYVSEPEERNDELSNGKSFYDIYYERLTTAYEVLRTYGSYRMIVPTSTTIAGAGSNDFLRQLIDAGRENFKRTGEIRIGLIGYDDVIRTDEDADDLVDELKPIIDEDQTGSDGKFVMTVVGRCRISISEANGEYINSPVAAIAGLLSRTSFDRGLVYLAIPNALTLVGPDLSKPVIQKLAKNKLNPLVRTTRAKRNMGPEVVLATDNTMGRDGSDYWSLAQVRLIGMVNNEIRAIGSKEVGRTEFYLIRTNMDRFLSNLVKADIIRDYKLDVTKLDHERQNSTTDTVIVELSLKPYHGIRDISFIAKVGPDPAGSSGTS